MSSRRIEARRVTADRLRFRSFAAGDLPALQALREAAFAPVFDSFRATVGAEIAALAFVAAEDEQAKLLADACRDGSGQRVVVAERGGEVVGFVTFSADTANRIGEIGLNAVHPRHAGQGIGTRMYRHVLARMRRLGMSLATVSTGGDESHAPARRAYAKVGFGPAIPAMSLYRLL
jgi:GNAT superfamily N-acetyltransferase